MPKSRVRKKKVYTSPAQKTTGGAPTGSKQRHSAAWVPGVALGLAIVGMIWLVVFYLSEGALPLSNSPRVNIGAGFSCIVASLFLFTRWR